MTVDSDVYVWGGKGKAPLGLEGQDEEYKAGGTRKASQTTVDRCASVCNAALYAAGHRLTHIHTAFRWPVAAVTVTRTSPTISMTLTRTRLCALC